AREVGDAPPAIRQRGTAAQEQESAPAAIDELADQLALTSREVRRFDRTDDDGLVGEEIFRPRRKAVAELRRILDALAIDLVLGGPQHGDELDDAVVFFRPADELVLPARLSFDVQ